ncbi:Homeobox protein tos8 [Paramarasmius palmivorus]|uniref:Homeobox protein tos8 n=1 Tax=Paramarasmius palmivorus TaxID=297713 RepID=A0AAW0B7K6_9AGAR
MALYAVYQHTYQYSQETQSQPNHAIQHQEDGGLELLLSLLKEEPNNASKIASTCVSILSKTPHAILSLVERLENPFVKIFHRPSSDVAIVSYPGEIFLCPLSDEARHDAPHFRSSKEMLECLLQKGYAAVLAMESVVVRWAPFVMEMIQHLLDDCRTLSPQIRRACIQSLLYLNKQYGTIHQSIYLRGVAKEGSHPVSGGGFADIWRGRLYASQVCLKVLRVFMDSFNENKLLKDLSSEILIWRQLRHPHILKFLGIDEELFKPSFCIVSPWMHNGTLISFSRTKSHSLERKVEMANILVSANENCCLGDFGLSTFENNSRVYQSTSQAALRGSVPWLAPELVNPDDMETESRTTRDIYAFGCTIFEIISGNAPFAEKKLDVQIMIDVLKGLRPQRPDLCPDWLWNLVKTCWAEDISQRPTASQITELLCRDRMNARIGITPERDEGCATGTIKPHVAQAQGLKKRRRRTLAGNPRKTRTFPKEANQDKIQDTEARDTTTDDLLEVRDMGLQSDIWTGKKRRLELNEGETGIFGLHRANVESVAFIGLAVAGSALVTRHQTHGERRH